MLKKMSTEPGFSWIPPLEIERRVATIPLPNKVKIQFYSKVHLWAENSGVEWTVGRLKSLKECILASYAKGALAQKPGWFRTTRSGRLAGVEGTLYLLAMKDARHLKAVLNLVNILTGVTRTCVNDPMLQEIRDSIQQPAIKLARRSGVNSVGVNEAYKAFRRLPRISQASKRCGLPVPITVCPPTKAGHAKKLSKDVMDLAGTPLQKGKYSVYLDAALGASNELYAQKFSTVVGDIGITHEPGLKTRYFAAPNVVIQRALDPLKALLLRHLQRFPWDCTLDQRKADNAVRAALEASTTVHSVDMSKATDSFPWEWQMAVGRQLVLAHDVSGELLGLLDTVVREGQWRMPDRRLVRWTKGQPLGLGPSFPLFTISHGILLYVLNEYTWDEAFYILGDDVIILDDELASKYREVLKAWHVQVSETKSFRSGRIAQFAGVTYTSEMQFHLPKWRPFTGHNLLDLAAWWYPGLTDGLPDHELITWVLSLPEPYGLGRNPEGIPMDQRFDQYLVEALIDAESRREQLVYPATTRVSLSRMADLLNEEDPNRYPLTSMLAKGGPLPPSIQKDGIVDLTQIELKTQHRRSTDRPLSQLMLHLMDGTYVEGYPTIGKPNRGFDRYTLGTIRAWKQVRKVAYSLKIKSECA